MLTLSISQKLVNNLSAAKKHSAAKQKPFASLDFFAASNCEPSLFVAQSVARKVAIIREVCPPMKAKK
jgi:hypothetical protein